MFYEFKYLMWKIFWLENYIIVIIFFGVGFNWIEWIWDLWVVDVNLEWFKSYEGCIWFIIC